MSVHVIQSNEDVPGAAHAIRECLKEQGNAARVFWDLETYSLLYQATKDELYKIPQPIPYYGPDIRTLENDALKRTGLKLKSEMEGHTALFQIGLDPTLGTDEQFIFDCRRIDKEVITKNLKDIIEDNLVIYHNGIYECKFAVAEFDIWPQRTRDTRILGQMIHAGDNYEHTLPGELKKFLDKGFFIAESGMSFKEFAQDKKINQTSDWTNPELTPRQIAYAAGDVRWPAFLYAAQKKYLSRLIKKNGQEGFMDTIRLSCDLVLEFALAELRGVPLDAVYHRSVIEWLDDKFERAVEGVGQYFSKETEREEPYEHTCKNGKVMRKWHRWTEIHPINVKAPQQIKDALSAAGVKLPKIKPTEAATLKKVRHEHPAIEYILRAKKAGHLNSNYGRCLIDSIRSDGRIHYSLHVVGTKTNRSSASSPNIMKLPMHEFLFGEKNAGTTFRRSFSVPLDCKYEEDSDDWIWLSADLSQIELRSIAEISGEPKLIDELSAEDGDFHAVSGQLLMDLDYKPTKDSYERKTIGKTGGFQVLYKSGGKALADYMYDKTIDTDKPVKWTAKEAQAKIERFKSGLPRITEAMDEVEEMVRDALERHTTLRDFRNRKALFEIFTKGTVTKGNKGRYTVYEKWCLTETQEKMVREYDDDLKAGKSPVDKLSKFHKVMREYPVLDDEGNETGETIWKESSWNEYYKTINTIGREAWNFLFQGECAILFKLATLNIGQEIRNIPGIDKLAEGIIFPVHDELNLLIRRRNLEAVKEIVMRNMIQGGELFIQKVPMKAEMKSGSNWAECH